MIADGMIFAGPHHTDFHFAGTRGANAKARGWYMEGGWFIPDSKFELDVRYDTLVPLIDTPAEYAFSKWTLGTQYHFTPKTRLTFNYDIRKFECTATVAPTKCVPINNHLNGVGNRISAQMTKIF